MSEGSCTATPVVVLTKVRTITTDIGFAESVHHFAFSIDHAVWVPAFAGTTYLPHHQKP